VYMAEADTFNTLKQQGKHIRVVVAGRCRTEAKWVGLALGSENYVN
jgi:hypothetical protein